MKGKAQTMQPGAAGCPGRRRSGSSTTWLAVSPTAATTVVSRQASSSRFSASVATESWLPPSSNRATPAACRRTTSWLYSSRA